MACIFKFYCSAFLLLFLGKAVKCQTIFTKQVSESQFRNRTINELKETHYSQRPEFQGNYSSPDMNYGKNIGP